MVETQDNKQYNFKESEEKLKKFWEAKKIYSAKPGKKAYYVDTPPPTVSGKMHLGHAFSYSQQDFIVRFRRMFSGDVVYPFGTDDNGLPTERLIEKLKTLRLYFVINRLNKLELIEMILIAYYIIVVGIPIIFGIFYLICL